MRLTPVDFTRPRPLVRLEGVAVLGLSLIMYTAIGKSWWLFFGVLVVPDLAILAYLRDPRWGAATYNLLHTYVFPLGLFAIGFGRGSGVMMALALIWGAHIGIDRALGLGLKYQDSAFRETHVQKL